MGVIIIFFLQVFEDEVRRVGQFRHDGVFFI